MAGMALRRLTLLVGVLSCLLAAQSLRASADDTSAQATPDTASRAPDPDAWRFQSPPMAG